jgi:hypothetical protein
MTILFAASHPDRVRGLIITGSFAKLDPDDAGALLDRVPPGWGKGVTKDVVFPHIPSEQLSRDQCAQLERMSSTPGNIARQVELMKAIDVRATLPAVSSPTLVLHRELDPLMPLARGREIAEHIPGARLVTGAGVSHTAFDEQGVMAGALTEFLLSLQEPEPAEEQLATVLVCHGAALEAERANAERFRGKALASTSVHGEAVYVFDRPTRAVECAIANRAASGTAVQGLTLGLVALRDDRVAGAATVYAAEAAFHACGAASWSCFANSL